MNICFKFAYVCQNNTLGYFANLFNYSKFKFQLNFKCLSFTESQEH